VIVIRILQPKDGQTYLYFYKNSILEPSQDITAIKKLLRECGCKIGPAWKRKQPEFYICECEQGEFRLINDTPAIYIESDNSSVISHLASRLIVACHRYKVDCEVRMKDGTVAVIKDYIEADYLVEIAGKERQVTEEDIICIRVIPDSIVGRHVEISMIDADFGEYLQHTGKVIKQEISGHNLCITIEVNDWDIGDEKAYVYEQIIYENEIKSIKVLNG